MKLSIYNIERKIGYISQRTEMFSGTILDNITLLITILLKKE